ncbi:MAG: OsmC family protein [Methanomassiliicoccus sp.]|nr:OsmC family protein [Methanomassiliicoccus sp.]
MVSTQQEMRQSINGVDIKKLEETIQAINGDPDMASFTFHAVNEWVDGARNKTIVQRYEGGNRSVVHPQPFVIHSDEPEFLLGEDSAPSSIVSLLHSLASCLSVTIVYNAAARGIAIDKLSISMEGDIDVHGFLGLSKEVRPGLQDMRVLVDLRSDAPRDEVEDLVRYSQKRSPILDSLRNRIPVEVELV